MEAIRVLEVLLERSSSGSGRVLVNDPAVKENGSARLEDGGGGDGMSKVPLVSSSG